MAWRLTNDKLLPEPMTAQGSGNLVIYFNKHGQKYTDISKV